MLELRRFIPEALRPKPKEQAEVEEAKNEPSQEFKKPNLNVLYETLAGVWPEMRHAVEQRLKDNGLSSGEIKKAVSLMNEAADNIFLESAKDFLKDGDFESAEQKAAWIKTEWRIAFKRFEKLLKDNNISLDKMSSATRKGVLESYLAGGFKGYKEAQIAEDASEDDLEALKNIIPLERYNELVAKKQEELSKVREIEKDATVADFFSGLEDEVDMDRAA